MEKISYFPTKRELNEMEKISYFPTKLDINEMEKIINILLSDKAK